MTLVVGETVEDVILGMACSCLENGPRGAEMGLLISDRDRRAFYPLFPSTELQVSVRADAGHLDLSRVLDTLRDILTDKWREMGGLMVKSRQMCNWLKIAPMGVDV